jgi:hypothetical protein
MNPSQANSIGNMQKRLATMRALRDQHSVTSFAPYFSRVVFPTARTGTGPYTYDIPAGTAATAFGYGRGQDMAAGGLSGTTATYCDTNIQQATRTNGGENVEVFGISCQIDPTTADMQLAAKLMASTSVKLQLNGGKINLLMGTPLMIPGSSGLYGLGQQALGAQPIGGGRPQFGAFTNGLPGIENQRPIPEHFVWTAEGERDSSLSIQFIVERDVSIVTQLADESAVANSGTAPGGVRGYANPAASAVYVSLMVQLHGLVWSARSAVL